MKRIFSILMALFFLSSCNQANSSSSNLNQPISNWNHDELDLMQQVLGENQQIPYFYFKEYECEISTFTEGTPFVYIYAKNANKSDLLEYSFILKDNQFNQIGIDLINRDFIYIVTKELTNSYYMYIQYLYDSTFEGIRIQAYLREPAKESMSWPAQEIATFTNTSLNAFPAYENGTRYTYHLRNVENHLIVYLSIQGIPVTAEQEYKEILQKENWSIDDSQFDTYGYIATKDNLLITFYLENNILYISLAVQ